MGMPSYTECRYCGVLHSASMARYADACARTGASLDVETMLAAVERLRPCIACLDKALFDDLEWRYDGRYTAPATRRPSKHETFQGLNARRHRQRRSWSVGLRYGDLFKCYTCGRVLTYSPGVHHACAACAPHLSR